MKKINAIIQARMGSKRLPGKTLMPILRKPMLKLLLERLKYSKRIDQIILATTTNQEDDDIEKLSDGNNVACYRGSSHDVLNRVYLAAKGYKTDVVVGVTGDCPLLDPWLIDDCIDIFLKSDCDYLSNFIEQSYPPGIDVQIYSFNILEEIDNKAKDMEYREHVTLYFLKHPEKYKLLNIAAPPENYYPDWHIELDEYKDYELIKKIYENLYPGNPNFSTMDIINLLKNNPEWLEINKNVERVWKKVRNEVL
tara:strand:+ start:5432 stop:6187 length:756 start_codon:yes stop_codon:yes gene_type:complete